MPTVPPLSRRTRVYIVLSAVWLLLTLIFAFYASEECYRDRCGINAASLFIVFLSLGLLPLAIGWGFVWARKGAATQQQQQPRKPSGWATTVDTQVNRPQGADVSVQPSMSEVLADRLRGTVIRTCKVCGRSRQTRYVLFNENISYFFARRERSLSGFLCYGCTTKKFFEFEIKTLLFTWWGLIGMFVGPGYLIENFGQFVSSSYHFLRDRRSAN